MYIWSKWFFSYIWFQNFTDDRGCIFQKKGDTIQASFTLDQCRLHLKSWQKKGSINKKTMESSSHTHNGGEERPQVFYLDNDEVCRLNNLDWNRIQCQVLEQIKASHPDKELSLLDFSSSFSPISLQMGCHGYSSGTVIMKSEFHELYEALRKVNGLSQLSYEVLELNSDLWQGLAGKHDVVLCDPVEQCGALRQQVFEDLELLK